MIVNNHEKNILIVVDMQHDFVDGSLGTSEAQAIVSKVDYRIKSGNFDDVYYTFDTHYNNYDETLEGQKLPVKHCQFRSLGWSLATENLPIDDDHAIEKETFGFTEWEEVLPIGYSVEDPDIKSITIVGLCTDICVISNALILRAILPNTQIICDASCCAGTTPEAHKAALTVMKSCQIDVINE